MKPNHHDLISICVLILTFVLVQMISSLSLMVLIPVSILIGCTLASLGLIYYEYFSSHGAERKKRIETVNAIPRPLKIASDCSVQLGKEIDLKMPVYLPDTIRSRHVHILGATGSGKTESVILNFLKQDIGRGYGAIILDAKGDESFLDALKAIVDSEKLRVFDLGSNQSMTYSPLIDGSPLESAQRLFASLIWSEEYYKSKAMTAIQKIFEGHHRYKGRNPTLSQIATYLSNQNSYQSVIGQTEDDKKSIAQEFNELAGLRDQIRLLTMGSLSEKLSPTDAADIELSSARSGNVLYFRLQSLMSPQLVSIVGRLVINHLGFLAGSIQRASTADAFANRTLVPVYFDEFASFACPEFADLISKARSAGFALHFSHQSVGDIKLVSEALLSQITDNSGTKIVMRINDPDTAEFFARTFGTRLYEKLTKRVSNVQNSDEGEFQGEGSSREAHQFRASPDLFKNHPTGVGSVLVSHGFDTEGGASCVFRVRFPRV